MSGFGNSMLLAGLAMALLSLSAYVSYSRGGKEQRGVARGSFVVSALAVLAASVALMYAFLAGRYDIQYVAGYSSSDLPLIYRISAFWAGQEGSFLLWALMGAAIGLALMRQAGSWEGPLMALFNATQAFLLLLMVIRSPFAPGDPGAVEGHGLNPLLQDPWMAIHPPLIFLGYAALAVPFVFAIAALLRRDYDGWVARALPWTLFAWVGLGAGIFVGGYWAYRVLGWGGYWGWDPEEKASHIPWLLATALLHG
ncbi:MAG: cytochrome c biogenesis protein CcsA, partial [Armatimonadetes bacterium]|nr:cytochrome c biogenesis protein CcsA [Armatimonadota bacterium]